MSFYLLKSTYVREQIGDAIIKKDKIVSAGACYYDADEDGIKYLLNIELTGYSVAAKFNTEDELRKELEIIFESKEIADNILITDETKEARKKRAIAKMY